MWTPLRDYNPSTESFHVWDNLFLQSFQLFFLPGFFLVRRKFQKFLGVTSASSKMTFLKFYFIPITKRYECQRLLSIDQSWKNESHLNSMNEILKSNRKIGVSGCFT